MNLEEPIRARECRHKNVVTKTRIGRLNARCRQTLHDDCKAAHHFGMIGFELLDFAEGVARLKVSVTPIAEDHTKGKISPNNS